MADMTLEDRCRAWLGRLNSGLGRPTIADAVVTDLANFVRAEIGRAASAKLDDTEPLVLYFPTEQDRADFVDLIHEAKPGMISRKWP